MKVSKVRRFDLLSPHRLPPAWRPEVLEVCQTPEASRRHSQPSAESRELGYVVNGQGQLVNCLSFVLGFGFGPTCCVAIERCQM